jgi:hypothetical protein
MRQIFLAILCGAALVPTFVRGPAAQTQPVDAIDGWSVTASQLAAAPPAMHPLRAPITLAMVHLAMYDAVNSVLATREPYAVMATVSRPASADAAAIEAGYRVLLNEFPSQAAALDAKRQALVASVPDGAAKTNGLAVGSAVANQLLTVRANDARNATRPPFKAGSGAGAYVSTPALFAAVDSEFLAYITPFTMTSPSQFRTAGPPPLESTRYATDYNEVVRLGAKLGSARTAAQTETGNYWQPLAGTVWPVTIRRMAKEQGLNLADKALFEAAAFSAFADGLIACWDAKFHFQFWRPVTAIREGENDRNSATGADPAWEPLFDTPNFPEYPSGHACATAAVAHVIEGYFDPDVPIPTHSVRTNTDRTYRKASDVVNEVIEARLLIGVHFRTANEHGADIGTKVAEQIRTRFFKPRRPNSLGAWLRHDADVRFR